MSVTDTSLTTMSSHAAIFDLDRTLIPGSSATVVQEHLVAAGIASPRNIPFATAVMKLYEQFGENWFMMQPALSDPRAPDLPRTPAQTKPTNPRIPNITHQNTPRSQVQ